MNLENINVVRWQQGQGFLLRPGAVPERLADVARHDHHQSVTQPITPSSIGKWQKSLTPEDFSGLPAGFSEMMTSLGYDLASDKAVAP